MSRGCQRIEILGTPLHNVSFSEAADTILRLARNAKPSYVVTPNVDHIMRLRRSPSLRHIYENAALSLADGMPVIWASRLLGMPLKEKVSGSDLFVELCRRSAAEGLRVFLLGGAPGAAEKAKEVLEAKYEGLEIAGTLAPAIDEHGCSPDDGEIIGAINAGKPHILFVGLGAPKQELWITNHIERLEAGVSIGVGISFDFVAGTVGRAPRWMQKAGLEWFWRLMQEPRRLWKRYLVDDLPFVWLVIANRLFRKSFS